MRIYIDGADNIGWSIDADRRNIKNSFSSIGVQETKSILSADIIHNIWWNNLLRGKFGKYSWYFRLRKNLLVTASNFIVPELTDYSLNAEFQKIKKIASGWICPSRKQKKILEKQDLKCYYQPFNLDLELFQPSQTKNRESILSAYNLPPEIFKNKVVIGSFQRDSLGTDLRLPKWQKGPEILIELLRDLPKDKFILLLAGPRRHYVTNKCKEYNIPYCYIGKETVDDDLLKNARQLKEMPSLYSLLDVYLVTSRSESGPKAILECASTKTFVLSTAVGLAADFLEKEYVFEDIIKMRKALYQLIIGNGSINSEKISESVERQYKNVMSNLDNEAMNKRLMHIYNDLIGSRSRIKKSI